MASPTISLEALFTTLLVDAYEDKKIAIFDVPGAYLHAKDMPKDKGVLHKLRGQFVDIMCEINPEHTKNIIYETGVKVLYLYVVKAIYGCIESALLWYNLFTETLQKYSFESNPYD